MASRDCTVNVQITNDVVIVGKQIIVNGIKLPPPPTNCDNITTINGKVYIDGYEFKNGKWKKTLRAWWHLWF